MPAERLRIGDRVVRLSNPQKVLYPSTGTTKRDVVDYLMQVAEPLIAHAGQRPVTRKRWVDGVGTARKPGKVFFQKQLERGAPDWFERVEIAHSEGAKAYPVITEPATLVWMANLAALELHVPQWRVDVQEASVDSDRQHPDRLVLDLDPGEGADIDDCAEVALLARELLVDMGLDPLPVTSGSKGIHLYARLDGSLTSRRVSDVAHELARSLESLHPDRIVSEMAKAKRTGRVLVDWSQNSAAKTTVAPYSLRGRERPTVAAPRTWSEIEAGGLEQLEMADVLRRLERDGDLLAGLDEGAGAPDAGGRGTGGARQEGRGAGTRDGGDRARIATSSAAAPGASDRLADYRAKRDAARTPEPIPDAVGTTGDERAFVIQEHRARRLHYDVRLEHEGVLVSWAVPKGPPKDGRQNRLAVQTEDHPLEYAAFEGTIPKGEYGAGTMRIWDSGTVELEKWRDDEVIGTLHGEPGGGLGGEPYRFALIRTDAEQRHWLLHRMQERAGGTGTDAPRGTGTDAPRGTARTAPKRAGKRRGERGAATRPRTPLRPMLATASEPAEIEDEREWSFEVKWDGWRAIVEVDGDDVRLTSRSGGDLAAAFPELLAPVAAAVDAGSAVLDGEIVVLGRKGASDFAALQDRAGLTGRAAERAAQRTPVTLVLFDALEVDGEPLVDEPLRDRQGRLDAIVDESARVKVSRPLRGSLDHVLAVTREHGLEGIIAKRDDSRYRSGRRSADWLKLKHERMREVVVVGWLEGKGALAGTVGSLVLALPGEGGLRYAGRVGTGLRDAERDRLRDALVPRRTPARVAGVPAEVARRLRWVRSVVGEVANGEQTASGALRHPVWRGLRHDKRVRDVR